ncbi:MAG TPA: PqqD family protein [Thermoanaerobaculia bacterium]|nr:PqqD family protein [Thermoanaerobaculia bacterium]
MTTFDIQVTVPSGVMFRDLDGEAVLLELGSGRYFGLNETGTRIWLLLQKHGSVETALRAMLDEYEVAEDRLRRELLSFVETLSSQRLVETHG